MVFVVLLATVVTIQSLSRANKHTAKINAITMAMHSALDQLQKEAGQTFENMEWSTETLVGEQQITNDRSIKVFSIVGPIDNLRGRKVTVIAYEYFDGTEVQKRSMSDYIQKPRVQLAGAQIKIKVVRKDNQAGIEGVEAKCPSQNGGIPSTADTFPTGIAILNGIFLSNTGVPITLNGSTVDGDKGGPCYFDTVAPPSFQNIFPSGAATEANAVLDLTDTPYEMVCAGVVSGKITHEGTGNGVPNYKVYIEPKPGTLIIPNLVNAGLIQHTVTGADGTYEFKGIIPGSWSVYPVGENVALNQLSHWPSLSALNDWAPSYTGAVPVVPFTPTTMNFVTLPGGGPEGKFRYASNFSNSDKKFNSEPTAPHTNLIFSKTISETHHFGASDTTFPFSATGAYAHRIQEEQQNDLIISDGDGDYSTGIFPRMAHKDNDTYPLDEQYQRVFVLPRREMPGNGTPIVVRYPDDPTKSPIFAIRYGTGSLDYDFRPVGTSQDEFAHDFFLGSNPSQDFHVLHKDQLVRIRGRIFKIEDGDQVPFPLQPNSIARVRIQRGSLANVGGIKTTNAGNQYVDPFFYVTPENNGSQTRYDTGDTIIPNLGTDETMLSFTYRSTPDLFLANILSNTICHTKERIGGIITRYVVIPTDLDIQKLEFYRVENNNQVAFTIEDPDLDTDLNVTGASNDFEEYEDFSASVSLHLEPGNNYNNIDIVVPDTALPQVQQYNVRPVIDNTGVFPTVPWRFAWSGGTKGPLFTYSSGLTKYLSPSPFVFNRILKAVSIHGTVRDPEGNIRTGIKVQLVRTGYDWPNGGPANPSQMVTEADAVCPGAPTGQQFCFQGYPFTAVSGSNFKLKWVDPNGEFISSSMLREGYDLYEEEWNIQLTRPAGPPPAPPGADW